MQAAVRQDDFLTTPEPLIDPNWREQRKYSHKEFWDMAYADLGKRYGLNDIQEANLIDPNWREQSMRPWDDVYEELCKDLGHHYGLSDIREA